MTNPMDPARIVENLMDGARSTTTGWRQRDRLMEEATEYARILAGVVAPEHRRLYWFDVITAARKEYVRASPPHEHRPEDYRPGGCNYEKHAAEVREERDAAERERRGIIADDSDADWKDIQPEDAT